MTMAATLRWQDTEIEVYYDDDHPYNVEEMISALSEGPGGPRSNRRFWWGGETLRAGAKAPPPRGGRR